MNRDPTALLGWYRTGFKTGVFSLHEERQTVDIARRRTLRIKLVVELSPAADDYLPSVWQNMAGGVPAADGQAVVVLLPVTTIAWLVNPHLALPVVEATGLDQAAVGRNGAGGAPDIGLDHEWAERVGGDVVLNGVGSAVNFESGVVGILAAFTIGQGQVGHAKVGAVVDDDAVVVEELHVHGGNANVLLQEHPFAAAGVGRLRNYEEEVE
ncbi:unnamed protein product [Malus baccata var. baccata]